MTSIINSEFSRRRFLQFSAMGAGAAVVAPYLSRLEAFAAPPVADNQGILVTIQLGGGNDGLNMVVPASDPAYAALRPSLRITNGLPLSNGFTFHPSLVRLKARYDQGKVAVVRGVGYQPPDLSHFSSTDIWMHGWGGNGTPTTGWAGRFLDGLPNSSHESLYGVSLHGNVNAHLVGAQARPSSLPLNIGDAFGIDRSDSSDARMYDTVLSLANASSGLGALGDLYDTTASELMQLTQRIRPAYGFADQSTDIAQQLVLAAHLINANLGIRVIDTALDGFDTHSDQAGWHATLLSRLDTAIDAFFAALAPRWAGQVTLMTFSEFGRRPDENGDGGTDHGAAAPLLVVGNNVRGGLHGTQPSLTDLDDDGDLKSTVDFRSVYASVLHTWLGADDAAVLGHAYSGVSLFASPPAAPGTGTPNTTNCGYWLSSANGGLRGFGNAIKFGSLTRVAFPIVGGAATPSHQGLWLCATDGGIFSRGDAHFYGSMGGKHLNQPIVNMAATPSGRGYWLCASDGGIFTFGDARFYGSTGGRRLNQPIIAMASTVTGRGYWLCASDGGIFTFGDARFYGSTGGRRLSQPIVAMTPTPTGRGYWLCGRDGAVYPFGDARARGQGMRSFTAACGFARTPTGNGYWIAGRDGSVVSYGDAPVLGNMGGQAAVLVST